MERSHSGRVRTLGKRVVLNGARGFESPPLLLSSWYIKGFGVFARFSPVEFEILKNVFDLMVIFFFQTFYLMSVNLECDVEVFVTQQLGY